MMSIICGDCGEIIDAFGRCECFDRLTGKEIKIEKDDDEMMNPVEQLKNELMERYGLSEDQVKIDLVIYPETKEEANAILADYDTKYVHIPKPDDYFYKNSPCASVYSTSFYSVVAFPDDLNKKEE